MKIANFEIDAVYNAHTGHYRMRNERRVRIRITPNPKDRWNYFNSNIPLKKLLSFIDYLTSAGAHPKKFSRGVLTELAKLYFGCSDGSARQYGNAVFYICRMSSYL